MNHIINLVVLLFFLLLSSCCTNLSKNGKESSSLILNKNIQSPPTTIQENQSIVTAEVQDINLRNGNEYSIKAKILNVDENPAYASMAVKGTVYELSSDYILNSKNRNDYKSNKEINTRLINLSKLKPGDKFKAIIYMGKNYNWYIQKVLK